MSPLVLAASANQVHLTSRTRIVAAILAIAFMLLILELIRRNRLQERYSVIWFVAGLGMLAGAAFPGLLEFVAELMGVRDTNVALFSIVLLLLLGLALNFSVIMSRQAAQITRLAQERALEGVRPDEAASAARPTGADARVGRRALRGLAPRRRSGRGRGGSPGPARRPGGHAAGSVRPAWARSSREPVAVEGDLLGAGGDDGEVAQPGGAELEGEVEDLGAAAAAGAFGLVGDVAGGAFEARLRLLLEDLAGRRFGLLAGRFGAVEQPLPGRRGDLALERRGDAALRLGPQLPSRAPRAAAARARGPPPRAEPPPRSPLSGRSADCVPMTSRSGRSAASSASRTAAGSGAKSIGWQREATVSSRASGSELSRIRWTNSGGSSSVFSSAFWLSSRIASAASTTKTRLPPSKGR